MFGCRGPIEPISLQWHSIAQLPKIAYYHQILFTNEHSGWVVGDSGVVLRTLDGGMNWQFVSIGSRQDFRCLVFVDERNGWFAGKGLSIFHTIDAGNSWSRQYVVTDSARRFLSMSFIDTRTGWIVSNIGEILHTTDAGNSWSFQYSSAPLAFTSVHFVNATHGWASSPNQIIVKTTDGGTNWETIDSFTPHSSSWCTDIKFIDEQRGWVATTVAPSSSIQSGSPLFYTEDGGATWTQQTVLPSLNLISLAVLYPGFAWVAGFDQIFYTSNGGNTWRAQYTDAGEVFVSLSFTDATHGWALSFDGTVLRYD